jgi:lipopolysaccharide export system protein LptA
MKRFFLLLVILAGGSLMTCAAVASEGPALSTASLTCDYMEYRSSENVVFARGNAVAISSGTRLSSDEMTLYLSSQVVVATGHAVLLSSGTHLEADELTLRQTEKIAEAKGHIFLQDQELSVLGDSILYNWDDTTGSLSNIYIQEGPWRTWGKRLDRLSPTHYRIERAAFSSCELNPPHYHFRAATADFKVRDRMSLTHVRSAAERTPFLYFPYYTRSLKDNKWSLTVDPGNSARNGTSVKSVFTYPVGDYSSARLKWDYFSKAGNGWGAEYSYSTSTVRGSISGYEIKDRIDQSRRWNLRFAHWQQLAPRWQVQSNVAMQSDQDVNNEFIGDDYQRRRQLGESDVAFTHNASWYSSRIFVQHDRALDSANNRYVTALTILPQLGFQSSALRLGKSNLFFNFGGNYRNEYDRPESTGALKVGRTDPILPGKDHYRQYADGTAGFSWTLPVTKSISLEPAVGISENWQSDQDLGDTLDPANLLQGAGSTGLNLRHRLTRSLDYDVGYLYKVRWKPNTFRRDHEAADHGTEQSSLSFFSYFRPSSSVWGRGSTTFDLRENQGYRTPRKRFSPPTLDVGFSPRRWFSLNGREAYQLYPTRKPQLSVMDIRLGRDDLVYFSAGFSYNVSRPGELDLSNGAAFNLTRGWWLSGDIQYTASGTGGIHYNAINFKEKNLVVKRDLHCWIIRVTYKDRPGAREVYFRLDLKSNMDLRKKESVIDEKQFYPARNNGGE